MGKASRQAWGLWSGSICFRLGLSVGTALLLLVALSPIASAIENKPLLPPVTSTPPKGTRVLVDADMFTYDTKAKVGTATGAVNLVYGPYTLHASKVVYKEKTGEFIADGTVELREPNGNILRADLMHMRNAFRDGFAEHIRALLNNDGVITAPYAKRVDGSIFIYEKAHYSACRDCVTRNGNPVWEIVSDETTHDTATHNLYHVNPRLKIAGQTVFGVPYWAMPDPSVTRRSGWLSPDIKVKDDFGWGLVTPYFWAISPSTDLTFRPVITTKQGPIADVEWRQATETGGYNIRGYGVYQFNDMPYPENGPWRGAVDTHGRFSPNENWTYGWDATLETDRAFLNSYGYDSRYYATNAAYTTGIWDDTYVNAAVYNFGSLSTSINPDVLPQAMPYVSGDTIWRDVPLGGQMDFSWNAYSLHRVSSNAFSSTVSQGTDQTRGTAQMNWHRQFYGDAGTVFTPFANMRSDVLIASNVPDPSSPGSYTGSSTTARLLPEVGLDARYPFIANLPFGQSIISPVFQIVASANEGNTSAFGNEDSITLNYDHTSLFLADRFTGLDRYEGGTHADIGLTYSLIGNDGRFIRASAGQSIHIAGQNSFVDGSGLADNESDLVAAIVARPFDQLSLSYETRVKDDFSAVNRQEVAASLNLDGFAANVSYLDFAAEPAYGLPSRQHWVSSDTKVALGDGWSVFGGVTYDFVHDVMTQKTVGLEFDCKCMNARLSYTNSLDAVTLAPSSLFLLSVEFATLGKTGFAASF